MLIRQKILARHWWPDGSTLDLFDDYETSQQAIYEFAGLTSFKEFQKFFQKTKRLFEALDIPMMQTSEPSQWDMAKLMIKQPSLARDIAPLHTMQANWPNNSRSEACATIWTVRHLCRRITLWIAALLSLIWQAEAKGVWGTRVVCTLRKAMKLPKNATQNLSSIPRSSGYCCKTGMRQVFSWKMESKGSPILLSSTETPEHWRQVN